MIRHVKRLIFSPTRRRCRRHMSALWRRDVHCFINYGEMYIELPRAVRFDV